MRSLIAGYFHLFVLCYEWSRKQDGDDDYFNVASASIKLTVILVLNVGWVAILLGSVFGVKPESPDATPESTGIVAGLAVLIFAANYAFFSAKIGSVNILSHF